jgi:predicted nuclease of predicted toxin-antitoxin system
MRFIVDAQLPKRLARWLAAHGHDVLHTLDLPDGNRTQDAVIADLACRQKRVVVTKDHDFVSSHLLSGRPPMLLLISTGNLGNTELLSLIERNIDLIEQALETNRFLELGAENLIMHG